MGRKSNGDLVLQRAPETGQQDESPALPSASLLTDAVLTFIAVPHRVEVDVVLVAAEEEEAEPGVEGVDRHDEEDADDVALLLGDGVIPQVCVDLQSAQHAELGLTQVRTGTPKAQGCCANSPFWGESSTSLPPQTHLSEHTQQAPSHSLGSPLA